MDPDRERIRKIEGVLEAARGGKVPTTEQITQALAKLRLSLSTDTGAMSTQSRVAASEVDTLIADVEKAMKEKVPGDEVQNVAFYGSRIVGAGIEGGREGGALGEDVSGLGEASTELGRHVYNVAVALTTSRAFRGTLIRSIAIVKDVMIEYARGTSWESVAGVVEEPSAANIARAAEEVTAGVRKEIESKQREGKEGAEAVRAKASGMAEEAQGFRVSEEKVEELKRKVMELTADFKSDERVRDAFKALFGAIRKLRERTRKVSEGSKGAGQAATLAGTIEAGHPVAQIHEETATTLPTDKTQEQIVLENAKRLVENFAGHKSVDPVLEALNTLLEKTRGDEKLDGLLERLFGAVFEAAKTASENLEAKDAEDIVGEVADVCADRAGLIRKEEKRETGEEGKSHGQMVEEKGRKQKMGTQSTTEIVAEEKIEEEVSHEGSKGVRSDGKNAEVSESVGSAVESVGSAVVAMPGVDDRQVDEIVKTMNEISEHVMQRYAEDLRHLVFETSNILKAMSEDKTMETLAEDVRRVMRALFIDETTGQVTFKKDVWQDVGRAVPGLAQKLAFVPIPRIDIDNESAHWVFDHILLKCSDILPEYVKVSTETEMVAPQTGSGIEAKTVIAVHVTHIKSSAVNVAWMYRKKGGLVPFGDVGLMDLDMTGGSGITLDARIRTSTGTETATSMDVEAIECHIDEVKVRMHETHNDAVYSILWPILNAGVKSKLEEVIKGGLWKAVGGMEEKVRGMMGTQQETGMAEGGHKGGVDMRAEWESRGYDV
ncbi:hypothetical protein BJ742DRAFT_119578 [Cladochytrium replicatum]|nr:hypothetical protein BJ742DRAFT_119578 [Cladochytrium replicatum]